MQLLLWLLTVYVDATVFQFDGIFYQRSKFWFTLWYVGYTFAKNTNGVICDDRRTKHSFFRFANTQCSYFRGTNGWQRSCRIKPYTLCLNENKAEEYTVTRVTSKQCLKVLLIASGQMFRCLLDSLNIFTPHKETYLLHRKTI